MIRCRWKQKVLVSYGSYGQKNQLHQQDTYIHLQRLGQLSCGLKEAIMTWDVLLIYNHSLVEYLKSSQNYLLKFENLSTGHQSWSAQAFRLVRREQLQENYFSTILGHVYNFR